MFAVYNDPYNSDGYASDDECSSDDFSLLAESKEIVKEIGSNIFDGIRSRCPYANDVINLGQSTFEWGRNTYCFAFNGSAQLLRDQMRIPGTETYYPVKEILVGDKKLIVVSDLKKVVAILKESRFGEKLHGGREFDALKSVIKEDNPLNTPNQHIHKCLKTSASQNEFGYRQINKRTVMFLNNAIDFIDEYFTDFELNENVNITQIIPYYTTRTTARAVFKINDNFENVAEKLETLEKIINNWILCKPRAFVPKLVDLARTKSEKELEVAVNRVIVADDNDGIASRMLNERKYSDSQVKRLKSTTDTVKNETQNTIISTIYRFIKTKEYQGHFFGIAKREQFDFETIYELISCVCLPVEIDDYYTRLVKNDEINKFLIVLGKMINEKDEDKFTIEQISSMIRTTFVIGSGTTKSTITSAIYCLLKNPEQQNALYETLVNLNFQIPSMEEWGGMSEENQKTTLKSINNELMKCDHLRNFIYETMRMQTPIPVQARTTKAEFVVDDELTVPAGTTIYTVPFLTNMDANNWDDPLNFDPSRFELRESRSKFHPFSVGKNRCMGENLAWASMKSFLAMFILRYKVLPPIDEDGNEFEQDLDIEGGFTYKFNKDLLVRLERRR